MRHPLLLLLVVLGVLWFWGLRRAATLFVVEIRDGRARILRGRMPPRLFSDFEDIAARAASAEGRVECRVRDGAPSLSFVGSLGNASQQQLRNVMAGVTAAQIRGGARR